MAATTTYYMNMETRSEPARWWKLAPVYNGRKLNKYRVNKHELHHHSVNRMPVIVPVFSSNSTEIAIRVSSSITVRQLKGKELFIALYISHNIKNSYKRYKQARVRNAFKQCFCNAKSM